MSMVMLLCAAAASGAAQKAKARQRERNECMGWVFLHVETMILGGERANE
jgi:hypothetical protein